MPMYKKMLVPLDGSSLAEVLIEYAHKLVEVMGVEAVVLNV
jgi:nucleotide-binding universal stress UspA family protein